MREQEHGDDPGRQVLGPGVVYTSPPSEDEVGRGVPQGCGGLWGYQLKGQHKFADYQS